MSEKMRQSYNKIEIEGWVNKKNIEEKNNEGKEFISGTIEIRTSETNIVPISLYANKYTKENKENSVYKGIRTIKNDYIDSTEVETWKEADKVRLNLGQIRSHDYVGKDKEIHTNLNYITNFVNRINSDKFEPKSKFACEIIYKGTREETRNGDETGRGFIDGFIVDYNGKLQPVFFVVGEKMWNKVEDRFEPGETLYIHGDIVEDVVEKTIEKEVEFGENEIRVIKISIHERQVRGIDRVDDEKTYNKKDIKKALEQRQKDLEDLKNRKLFNSDNDEDNVSDDDLPF